MYYVYDQNTGDYIAKVRSKRHLKRIHPPVDIETVIITDIYEGANYFRSCEELTKHIKDLIEEGAILENQEEGIEENVQYSNRPKHTT